LQVAIENPEHDSPSALQSIVYLAKRILTLAFDQNGKIDAKRFATVAKTGEHVICAACMHNLAPYT